MITLGIETSCDETAVAIVESAGKKLNQKIIAQIISSQIAQHKIYGGVVPELAARCHVETLPILLSDIIKNANLQWSNIDQIAVTQGPGLASSLLIGLSAAKILALRLNKPLVLINHLEAHIYAPLIENKENTFPMLSLLVSGGHTCLVIMEDINKFHLLGQTLDDAAGEALDKGAMLLNLGYPGGPIIEKTALDGDENFVRFPCALLNDKNNDRAFAFSFSGVKTFLRYYLRDNPDCFGQNKIKDIAASYQKAIIDSLIIKAEYALQKRTLNI